MQDVNITKLALARSLKELMLKKSFDKISISDITNNCKLNRQTFYYHFQDKYDLMNWIYYNEIFVLLVDDLDENNYEQKFYQMFDKMYKEKEVYVNALSMSAENSFKDYLEKVKPEEEEVEEVVVADASEIAEAAVAKEVAATEAENAEADAESTDSE